MKEYEKIIRIEYNKKLFDVFVDENHRKNFLEVRTVDGEEKFYHSSLEDRVGLNLIFTGFLSKKYNFNSETIIKKLNIREAVLDKFLSISPYIMGAFIGVGLLNRFGISFNSDFVCNSVQTQTKLEQATFLDTVNTLDINPYLTEMEKDRIRLYLCRLDRKLPDVDYTILNENLKTLKMTVNPNLDSNNLANYDAVENLLSFQNEACSASMEILFHEMTHALTDYIQDNYYIGFKYGNNYGNAIEEGRTELIANYLLDDSVDSFDDYLLSEDKNTMFYSETIAETTYDLMRLTKDEFTVYDYLFSDVNELEEELKQYDLDGIINCLDLEYDVLYNELTVVDHTQFEEYSHRLDSLLEVKRNEDYMSSSYNATDIYEDSLELPVAYYFEEGGPKSK